MIRFRSVDFTYDRGPAAPQPVLSSLDITFERGKVHALIGPSGCGKTTLVYLAAGLIAPVRGEVLIEGSPAIAGRERSAVILQNHGLFPWKSVYKNLALGLKIRGFSRTEIDARVERVMDEVSLSRRYAKLFPAQLSGGEQQRLAIARALVLDPDLLLLDEPFSSLDAMTREKLQDSLLELKSHRGESLTVMIVTHSIEEAVFLSDSIHIMSQDGSLITREGYKGEESHARSSSRFFSRCVEVRGELEQRAGGIR